MASIYKRRTYFVLIFLSFLCSRGSAQNHRTFNIELNQSKLNYAQPSGFIEMDSISTFFTYTNDENKYKRKYLYPFTYRIISPGDDVLIGFSTLNLKLVNDSSALVQVLFPGANKNTDYLLKIRHKADTLNGHRVQYYSREKSRKMYNADNAGTYLFSLEIPYEDKYNFCRIVFMHKDDTGDVEVYYFYNKGSEASMEKLFKKTPKMIKFQS